jgi:pteridine reductase
MQAKSDGLKGKVGVVTGGAKRVGRQIALTLAEHGMDVAFTYNTSGPEAKETLAEIKALGVRGLAVKVDFTQAGAAGEVHRAVDHAFGRCDALINNASIFGPVSLTEVSHEDFQRNMMINAWGPLEMIKVFAGMLKAHASVEKPESLGRIVNFVDIHVMGQPLKRFVAYNASKAAIREISLTAAMELAPLVTVNMIAPGVIAWPEGSTQEFQDRYMERVPLGRAGTPDDAAQAVLYLVKDAHYCTGQTIRVDGGRLWT